MLSLKSVPISQATSKINLLDLPAELIGSILNQLWLLEDLLSVSRVSKRLREETLPILFYSVNITSTSNGKTIWDYLTEHPALCRYIRQIIIRSLVGNVEGQKQDLLKFETLSPQMQNLRVIKVCSWDNVLFQIWFKAWLITRGIRVRVGVLPGRRLRGPSSLCQETLQNLYNVSPESLYLGFAYPSNVPNLPDPASMIPTLEKLSSLRSLNLVVQTDSSMSTLPVLPFSLDTVGTSNSMPALTELHLELPMCKFEALDEAVKTFFSLIPWSHLQRLSLSGNALIEVILSFFSTHLNALRCLHLKATDRRILPSDRTGQPIHSPWLTRQMWCASPNTMTQTRSLLQTLKCEELILEGYSSKLALPHVLSPKLRTLRFHICELQPSGSRASLRQASELRGLATLAPNMQRLELDVARIGNLWHSTAVPGVDVDVRIYQVLDAITSLPRLRHLRLFPQYFVEDLGSGRFEQPLTDDAAVHLFRRLKEKSTSLETLEVSSDNDVAKHARGFDPMSWQLYAHGDKIILTVRQANHDYEQRQVWVGERRLTTEIRRHSYKKPYVHEFQGWLMER